MSARRTRAFTLIELLLVLFILAAIAATAASLGSELDQQSRYDQTRARRELIRAAIVGDPGRLVDGQPVVSGFVADLGRLPADLSELLVGAGKPAWTPCAPETLFPVGSFDPAGAAPRGAPQGAGWRGPYLRAELEHDLVTGAELRTFRDGWKNVAGPGGDDSTNFGWAFAPAGAELTLHSPGADGAPGPTAIGEFSYAWDLPTSVAERTLVAATDHQVNLGDLVVRIKNRLTTTVHLTDVAVLVLTPDLTTGAVDWTSAAARQRSAALGVAGDAVPPGELGPARGLRSGSAFSPVPWGRRSLVLVRADSPAGAPKLLGPIVAVTLLPRTSLPDLVLELDTAP